MSDSAAHELSTQARRRPPMPTPIPVAPAPAASPSIGMAAYPVLIALSVGAHGVVLALLALIPIPQTLRAEPAPIDFVIAAPDPAPEPVVVPPEPVVVPRAAAIAPEPPRRRVVRETPPDPEPAPPPLALTAPTPGAGEWTQPEGSPDGRLGGVPNGTGTGLPSGVATEGVPEGDGRNGISRAALRRILAGYIRDTLSRYLDGRIDYPLAARREHIEGVVVLRVRLARDGRILGVRLSRSSGQPMLDTAALSSVQGLGSMPAPPQQIPWDDAQELPLPVTYVLR